METNPLDFYKRHYGGRYLLAATWAVLGWVVLVASIIAAVVIFKWGDGYGSREGVVVLGLALIPGLGLAVKCLLGVGAVLLRLSLDRSIAVAPGLTEKERLDLILDRR